VSLTAEILKEFEDRTALLELIPSSGGAFEVDIDGTRIFSKLDEGRFPSNVEIKKMVRDRVGV
jgi:selenoprotein W-related protein